MSKNSRVALALIGVAVIVAAAVLIGTGKDNTDATSPPAADQTTIEHEGATGHSGQTAATGATGGSKDSGAGDQNGHADENSGGASPQNETGGAAPEAAVVSPVLTGSNQRTIKASKGDTVIIRARSTKPATLHVHGYDETVELEPNKLGRLSFKATIDGEFEIELHYAGSETHAGTLRVSP